MPRVAIRLWLACAMAWGLALTVSAILQLEGTPEALRKAAVLTPLDARIPLLLAEAEPDLAAQHTKEARRLDPSAARPRILLALRAEGDGDIAAAERELLEAAALDRTFFPRWTLANFYFRQARWPEFWEWSRRAAAIYQGDLTGVMQLCLRVEPDPLAVLERLNVNRAGGRLDVVRALAEKRDHAGIARMAQIAAQDDAAGSRDLLLEACHQAGVAGQSEAAVAIRNALIRNRRHPGLVLEPPRGISLNNGSFERPPSGACFDWKAAQVEGVRTSVGPAGLRIEFDGRQAEREMVLEHWVPVAPGGRYRIAWISTDHLRENSAALEWWIDGERLAAVRTGDAEFPAGPRRMIRLYLMTTPKPGAVKPKGHIEIRSVSLRML